MGKRERDAISESTWQNQGPKEKLEEFTEFLDEVNWEHRFNTNNGKLFFDEWGTRGGHNPSAYVEYDGDGTYHAHDWGEDGYGSTPKEAAEKVVDLDPVRSHDST